MAVEEKVLKNGTKRYRANIYINQNRPRVTGKWRTLKKNAREDETEVLNSLDMGTFIDLTSKTLDEGSQLYFEIVAPCRLSEGVLIGTKAYYRNHIKPTFGHREMKSIKPFEIQKLWETKKKELANSTVIKLHTLMNQIYKQFIKWGELKFNPLDGVNKPPANYKKGQMWTKEEARTFLNYAKDYQTYLAFWLALNTGMRLGEIIGLTWDCVDFKNNLILVQQSYNRAKGKIADHTKTTTSMREISLSDKQMEVLRHHKQEQDIETILVCANELGGFLNEGNIRKAKKAICKHIGVKEIRFHDMRHTHASMLIDLGESPKYVQERLGHKDVKTTLNFYVHTQKSHHQETAVRFSNFFYDNE